MLVLDRSKTQEVAIDRGRIVVRVLKVAGDSVRLGFEADRRIRIDRMEAHVKREKKGGKS